MNVSIFLALLGLGVASAFPRVDDTLDAQSKLFEATDEEVSDMVEDLIDAVGAVLVQRSPNVLDTHSQEQSEEQQSNGTGSNHSDDLSLLIKPPKKVLGKSKVKGKLGKIVKDLGKKLKKMFKNASNVIKVAKHIGEHILGDAETTASTGGVFKVIGASAQGVNSPPLTPEDTVYGDETNEES